MNKTELINSVAEAAGLTKKDATKAVEAVFDTIQSTLAKGEKVQLIGFGNFESVSVQLVKDATRNRVKKSTLQQAKFLHLKQVKRLKMR